MFHLGPGVLPRKLLRIQAWGHWAPKLPQGTAAWCWGSCSPALPSLAPLLASVTLLVTGSLPLRLVRRLSAMRKNSREAGGDDGPEPQPWGQTSQWGYWSLPGCVTSEVFEPPPFAHRLKEKLTQHPSHGLAVQVATTCVKPAAPCQLCERARRREWGSLCLCGRGRRLASLRSRFQRLSPRAREFFEYRSCVCIKATLVSHPRARATECPLSAPTCYSELMRV